jgi:hypothetical protein
MKFLAEYQSVVGDLRWGPTSVLIYRLKQLEDENAKLKRLLADAMLDNAALKCSLPVSIAKGTVLDAVLIL